MLLVAFILVSCAALGAESVKCGRCDCYVDEAGTSVLNCWKRGLERVPAPADWEGGLDIIQPERNVVVKLSGNRLRALSGLPALAGGQVALRLKANRIERIEDDAFQNISRLYYLDLSHNRLTGTELRSEMFRGAYEQGVYGDIALKVLNVSHNLVHSLDLRLFQHTPDLRRLYLDHNPFEMLDQVTVLAISSAVNLEVLDLSYIRIDSVPADTFRGLVRLQWLDLSGNQFLTVPDSLGVLGPSLQYLAFNDNPVRQIDDDSFVGLRNLKELEVMANDRLEEVTQGAFTTLRRLRVLRLCHNWKLRYISRNAFSGYNGNWTLKEIYLDHNDLSELPTDLLPWGRLDVIDLSGNDWRCNCDLADVVTRQRAGDKFPRGHVPTCTSPMRLSGTYITKIPSDDCPDYHRMPSQISSVAFKIKHKYIVYGTAGVSFVVILGTIIGLISKKLSRRCGPDSQPNVYEPVHANIMV